MTVPGRLWPPLLPVVTVPGRPAATSAACSDCTLWMYTQAAVGAGRGEPEQGGLGRKAGGTKGQEARDLASSREQCSPPRGPGLTPGLALRSCGTTGTASSSDACFTELP